MTTDFRALPVLSLLVITAGCASMPGEVEGTITYADCRITRSLEPDEALTFGRQFVCSTRLTEAGQIMGGTCVSVTLADNGACTTAFVYSKKPFRRCTAEQPFLTYAGACSAEFDNGSVYVGP